MSVKYWGKLLVILAALLSSTGQLFWKLGFSNIIFMLIGFVFYGAGMVLLIKSMRLEKFSVAYPLMSISYIFTIIYGSLILYEPISWNKIISVTLLILGVICIAYEK